MATLESIGKARRWSGYSDEEFENNLDLHKKVINLAGNIDDMEKERIRNIVIDPYEDMSNIGKRFPKGTLRRRKSTKKSKIKRKTQTCKCK